MRCCGAAHGVGEGAKSTPGGLKGELPLGFGVNLEGKEGGVSLGADGISTWAFGADGFSREPVDPGGICNGKQQRETGSYQQGGRENMLSIAVSQQLSQIHNANSSHTVIYLAVLISFKIYAFWSFMYTFALWFIQNF